MSANGESDDKHARKGRDKQRITMRPLSEIEAQLPSDTSIASEEASAEQLASSLAVQYGGGPDTDKFRKNPLVPLGALGTGAVLFAGLMAFKSGNSRLSQQLMRARVFAQGATLAVLGVSVAGMSKAARASDDAEDSGTGREKA